MNSSLPIHTLTFSTPQNIIFSDCSSSHTWNMKDKPSPFMHTLGPYIIFKGIYNSKKTGIIEYGIYRETPFHTNPSPVFWFYSLDRHQTFPIHCSLNEISETHCLTLSPDNKILALGLSSGVISLHLIKKGQKDPLFSLEKTQFLNNTHPKVNALAFIPEGTLFASGATDGSLFLWDLSTQHIIKKFNQLPDPIKALDFNNEELIVATKKFLYRYSLSNKFYQEKADDLESILLLYVAQKHYEIYKSPLPLNTESLRKIFLELPSLIKNKFIEKKYLPSESQYCALTERGKTSLKKMFNFF
jgi:WD40 repeat protein